MSELGGEIGERAACATLRVSRATLARQRREPIACTARKYRSIRRLNESERTAILAAAHTDRFADFSVREIYATLLDEGQYLGSISSMYRVLRAAGETKERRALATHPARVKPELAADSIGRVWCWDITKLLGPQKWTYFQLYVIVDVFSRYVVGWRLEHRENAVLAEELFSEAIAREHVDPSQLTVHADSGPAMKSKSLSQLFADLSITRSHSRPHVSNDNPFIESFFKTLKYGSTYPGYFANIEQARAFCRLFFSWYNNQHRHSGIGLHTPADIHHGRLTERRSARQDVLDRAFKVHPERFVKGNPSPPTISATVYINRPVLANAA